MVLVSIFANVGIDVALCCKKAYHNKDKRIFFFIVNNKGGEVYLATRNALDRKEEQKMEQLQAEQSKTKPLFSTRELAKLIVPLMIEQFLVVLVGMVDTMMVATVGETAVSGISLVDAINVLLIQVFAALATGGAVVASQFLGRRDVEKARASAKQLLWVSTLLATFIAVFALVGNRFLLKLCFGNIEPAVMENAVTYFWLSALSYPFMAVYNSGAALFRSMGNSKVSMLIALLVNAINIGGNAFLIYQIHLGVAGAGIATLVSRIVAAVVIMVLLHHRNNPIYLEKVFHFKPDMALIRSILKIGIPNGIENGVFQVGKLMVAGLISSFGTAAIAANAICNNLGSMTNIPGSAIGLGLVTVVGQCVGAKDHQQARSYTKKLLAFAYGVMLVTNVLMILFAKPMIAFYNVSPEANEMAWQVLMVYCVVCIIAWPSSFTIPNALRAAGDAKFTMLVALCSMWIFRIGFSYILGSWLHMGLFGTWIAMEIDWVVRSIFFVTRFKGNQWEKAQVID